MITDEMCGEVLLRWLHFIEVPVRAGQCLLDRHPVESFDNLLPLADGLRLRVYYQEEMPTPGLSFLNPHRSIVIDESRAPEIRAFTMAHEIGHQVLHHGRFPARNAALEELEANLFSIGVLSRATNAEDRQRYLVENPEARSVLFECLGFVAAVHFPDVGFEIFERLLPKLLAMMEDS